MTDHPSNPPSQTEGEKIAEKTLSAYCPAWSICKRHDRLSTHENHNSAFRRLAARVDSALAAQEARYKAELDEARAGHTRWRDYYLECNAARLEAERRYAQIKRDLECDGGCDSTDPCWTHALSEAESRLREATEREKASADLLEFAWGVIANAHGGDWTKAEGYWEEAAVSFRERWHAMIGVGLLTTAPDAERYNRHIEVGTALAASEDRERRLSNAMEIATVRLEILLGRARGRDADRPGGEPARHGVTEIEVPGWIEEQRDILAATRSGPAHPPADKCDGRHAECPCAQHRPSGPPEQETPKPRKHASYCMCLVCSAPPAHGGGD